MNLLIPYVLLKDHEDPLFQEFTYGDVNSRGRKLRDDVSKGDYLFFHTSKNGKKYITAYYEVARIMNTKDACKNKSIFSKYKNPHLNDYLEYGKPNSDDVIVFGDPITSRFLTNPLPVDRTLLESLSLNIDFSSKRSESQTIVSSTRAWRELSGTDVKKILKAIEQYDNNYKSKLDGMLSTHEVSEVIEQDIESYIEQNPSVIGKELNKSVRQYQIGSGRADLIFLDKQGNFIVVEIKVTPIGRNAITQVNNYVSELKKYNKCDIKGVIICPGVMPAYEEVIRKQKKVKVLIYGWALTVRKWE